MATAENGVWLDRETGKVVKTKPVRARQLVAPGGEITPNVQALMDRYSDNYATVEQATAPPAPETRDLDDMTKDELLDEADRRGVDVNKSDTKGEILDALKGS